jgi:raffinose/stachyose/melibiose transport system permease protein
VTIRSEASVTGASPLAKARVVPATRARRGRVLRDGVAAWLFVLPALFFYALIVLIPTAQSAWYSLFDWDGISASTWVGLGNYLDFLTDPQILTALGHTVVLIVFFSLLPILLGLLSAALLSRGRTRGEGFFRWVIFLPQVLTSVVVAVTWKQLYAPDGPVNEALRAVGLGALAQDWLGSFDLALPALGLVGTWTTVGLCMLLFVSGAMAIPSDLFDAARADGAGPVREFFAVTLPGLVPQLAVAITLTIIGAIRAFDLIWLTTRGGPGTSTLTPALLLYSQAFQQQNVGAAAAIGVVLAALSLAIALAVLRITSERD